MAERSAILAGAWDFYHEDIEDFSSSNDEQDTMEKATKVGGNHHSKASPKSGHLIYSNFQEGKEMDPKPAEQEVPTNEDSKCASERLL